MCGVPTPVHHQHHQQRRHSSIHPYPPILTGAGVAGLPRQRGGGAQGPYVDPHCPRHESHTYNPFRLTRIHTHIYIYLFINIQSQSPPKTRTHTKPTKQAWVHVSRSWASLESIFLASADIRSQLPEDTKASKRMNIYINIDVCVVVYLLWGVRCRGAGGVVSICMCAGVYIHTHTPRIQTNQQNNNTKTNSGSRASTRSSRS